MEILRTDAEIRKLAEERARASGSEWQAAEAEEIGLTHRVDALERKFIEAFPAGDWAGHCRYHQVQIELLLERRKMVAALTQKTLEAFVLAAIVALGVAVWQYIKTQLK